MKVVGIDLAGRANNPSGFALFSDRGLDVRLVYSDEEMIELCERERPVLIAIDAPLSLPRRGNLREADASLIKRGLRVFPPTFSGMRSLTERGMRLANEFRAKKFRVIEIHPRTSGVILFKSQDRRRWIDELGKRGWRLKGDESEHEVDATVAALTGVLHIQKKTEEVGAAKEGTIVIPRSS